MNRIVESSNRRNVDPTDSTPCSWSRALSSVWSDSLEKIQHIEIAHRNSAIQTYRLRKIYAMLNAFTAGYVICFHLHGTWKHSLAQCRQTESNIRKLQVACKLHRANHSAWSFENIIRPQNGCFDAWRQLLALVPAIIHWYQQAWLWWLLVIKVLEVALLQRVVAFPVSITKRVPD